MMAKNFVILLVLATSFGQSWTEDEITYSKKEMGCFAEEKVYDETNGSCQKLGTAGSCKEGYTFVLEKPSPTSKNDKLRIKGICAKLKCEVWEYYWAKTQSCVTQAAKAELCGSSPTIELLNDNFGEAECRCQRNPPRARLDGDKDGACHKLYTQGPCPQGKIFVMSDDEKDEVERAICINDPCYQETRYRKRLGTLNSTSSTLAAWENGTCYELNTQGPCPADYTFQVHTTYLKPSCVMLTNTIFNLEKPQDCYQDENGDCQKRINANKYQNAEKYKIELFNSVSAARKRRTIRNRERNYTKKPETTERTWFAAHYN